MCLVFIGYVLLWISFLFFGILTCKKHNLAGEKGESVCQHLWGKSLEQ